MNRISFYLVSAVVIGLISCNTNKKDGNSNTVNSTVQTDDEARVISEQSEPDTLKGSLKAKAIGSIGALEIAVNYYSPAVRGRIIWGGLVAFDKVWVTGAHKATNIEFNREVKIGETLIAPGKYALFTIPGKEEWTIIINKNWNQHLADDYSEVEDIARIKLKPETDEAHQERLRIVIESESDSTGELLIYWDKLEVSLPIEIVN